MASRKRSVSEAFSLAFHANMDDIQAAGRQRRKLLHDAWEDIDKGWQALQQRLIEVGITKNSEERVLRLNVGGSHVNLCQSALAGQGSPETRTLANLFQRVWDKRLPRDGDGCIVLDISPTCVKHVMHALLKASGGAKSGTTKLALLGDGLPPDERAHLPYVASALGLAGNLPIEVTGGSTVLEPNDLLRMSATILGWCPGQPSGLELIYRASRDGGAPEAFHTRCGDDSPSTVTLCRVATTGRESRHSIVGGFSSVPWTPVTGGWSSSPGAFVFMLVDGTSTGSGTFQPVKWGLKDGRTEQAVWRSGGWPYFSMSFGVKGVSPGELVVGANDFYGIPAGDPILTLNGNDVVEMETFRVCPIKTAASVPSPMSETSRGLVDVPAFDTATMSAEGDREDDIRTFGVSIADSLMEERIALGRAHDELEEADAKAVESVNALAAVYGPHVAAGEEDSVIELSARGTRMTTLHSTLQACPESALAIQFDEERWPATKKDVDERGRRVIDCSPSVFSKVLDVLRMRKRAAWSGGGSESDGRVAVKAADWAAFEEFVGMYFPGCESLVMDFVEGTSKESIEPRAAS